jgi:hypothetical protein
MAHAGRWLIFQVMRDPFGCFPAVGVNRSIGYFETLACASRHIHYRSEYLGRS